MDEPTFTITSVKHWYGEDALRYMLKRTKEDTNPPQDQIDEIEAAIRDFDDHMRWLESQSRE